MRQAKILDSAGVTRPAQWDAAAPPSEAAIRPISDGDFAAYQALIHREAGIFLSDVKRALLVGRLARRLRELGMRSYREYLERVREDEDERVRMIDAISTNETHFFREPRQFEFLERRVIPSWVGRADAGRRARRVRVWSAACSTGEEPYSLAMVLLHHLPPSAGWEIEVQATDISTRVLDRACAALWPVAKAAEIPTEHLKRFMLRGVGPEEGRMKAGPELRAVVRFDRLNLNEDTYPLQGPFDLVFCRNVLIYFKPETKARVLARVCRHLAADGYLFLGHAESVMGLDTGLGSVGPNVYGAAAERPRRRGAA